MKFTENFNLNLPDLDDMSDVEKMNENFQTIDTKMKSLETDPELAANVVDIKNKIGTESDADTQPTLFGRLAQLKNVLLEKLAEVLTKVTGIDGKIGDIGDPAGEESLVGLVKSVNKTVENGDGFYRYSKTEIKHQIKNWAALPTSGSTTYWTYLKLLNVYAEKNGTIYVKLVSTQQAIVSIIMLSKTTNTILTSPEKTKMQNMAAGANFEFADFKVEYVNSIDRNVSTTNEWIFPVTAGVEYTFLLQLNNARSMTVNEFSVGYTDTKEA